MDDSATCMDDLDACFVACDAAYVRLREGGVDARDSTLGNALLLAAATSMLASESLLSAGRATVLVTITADACRDCAEACERDGAQWLAAAHDACAAAVAACAALREGNVANGD